MRLSVSTGITDNAGRQRLRALSYCKPTCIARATSLRWIPPSREEATDSIHSSDNAAYGNSNVVCSIRMYSGTCD